MSTLLVKLVLRKRNIVTRRHKFYDNELTKADVRYDPDREEVPEDVSLISTTRVSKRRYDSYYIKHIIERGQAKDYEYMTKVPSDSD